MIPVQNPKSKIQNPEPPTPLATTLAIAFVILSISPLILIGTLTTLRNFQGQQNVVISQQQKLAAAAAGEVSAFLSEIFNILYVADRVGDPLAGNRDDHQHFVEKLIGLQPAFREVALLDNQGQELARLSRMFVITPADLINRSDSELFKQVSAGQNYISPVFIDEVTGEPLVTVAVPIITPLGDVEGSLAAVVNLKFMWDLVASLSIGEEGVAYVVDKSGNLLAYKNPLRVLRGENLSYLKPIADFISGSTSGDGRGSISSGINATKVVASYVTLDNPDWVVVIELPLVEAYQPVILELVVGVDAMLILAALAAVAGIHLSRRLAKPLLNLTQMATKIANGHLELEAPVAGPAEVGRLAAAFNNMTFQLRNLIHSLEQQIEEHKEMAEALQKSEMNLAKAQEIAQLGSWEWDIPSNAFHWSNEIYRIFELERNVAPSNEFMFELIHPDDKETFERTIVDSFAGSVPEPIEFRIVKADGQIRVVHAEIEISYAQNGNPDRIVGTLQDITERKQAEAEREKLIVELEVKNAELERFTYTVSHDLKSPLVTIRGFLGLLEQDAFAGKTEQMKEDIKHIRNATEKMKLLLDDLLELSRVGRVINPPQEVFFGELAYEAVELVAGQIVGQGVQVEIAPNLPLVCVDRPRLLEVLQNLVDNAVKFMGDQPEPHIKIGARSEGEKTIYYVRDNGMGIDPHYQEQVFGLFERLDQKIDGTGIGLALVKRIVELHGGRIWIESEGSGQGSTFCFTLAEKDETGYHKR